jgi:hypothetical protein
MINSLKEFLSNGYHSTVRSHGTSKDIKPFSVMCSVLSILYNCQGANSRVGKGSFTPNLSRNRT